MLTTPLTLGSFLKQSNANSCASPSRLDMEGLGAAATAPPWRSCSWPGQDRKGPAARPQYQKQPFHFKSRGLRQPCSRRYPPIDSRPRRTRPGSNFCRPITPIAYHWFWWKMLCTWRVTHPLCTAARGSWLLFTLIISREKSRKNKAMPKQTRYTAL